MNYHDFLVLQHYTNSTIIKDIDGQLIPCGSNLYCFNRTLDGLKQYQFDKMVESGDVGVLFKLMCESIYRGVDDKQKTDISKYLQAHHLLDKSVIRYMSDSVNSRESIDNLSKLYSKSIAQILDVFDTEQTMGWLRQNTKPTVFKGAILSLISGETINANAFKVLPVIPVKSAFDAYVVDLTITDKLNTQFLDNIIQNPAYFKLGDPVYEGCSLNIALVCSIGKYRTVLANADVELQANLMHSLIYTAKLASGIDWNQVYNVADIRFNVLPTEIKVLKMLELTNVKQPEQDVFLAWLKHFNQNVFEESLLVNVDRIIQLTGPCNTEILTDLISNHKTGCMAHPVPDL